MFVGGTSIKAARRRISIARCCADLRWNLLRKADDDTRQQLMPHGLFHRTQPELGFMTLA
jgi:hypothetical protein